MALAVALGAWVGARVRVYLGATRAACVAFYDGAGFRVVDPTRTFRNAFDIAPMPDLASTSIELRAGLFVQILCQTRWRVAYVTKVSAFHRSAQVRFVCNDRVFMLDLTRHSWRRLARGDNEDIETTMRALIKHREPVAASSETLCATPTE